jgi:hypothetical protein
MECTMTNKTTTAAVMAGGTSFPPGHFDQVRRMWPGLCNYEPRLHTLMKRKTVFVRKDSSPTVLLPNTPKNGAPGWMV